MSRKNRLADKASEQRKVISHIEPKSPIAEQYRSVRTNIQFASLEENLQKILVTSAGPGEGKSTTVANLAVVFAQQGKRVLLVDADLRKPTVHYTFQTPNTLGLTNVLTGQSTFEGSVSRTDVEKLDLMTSGPIPPNPSELLGSRAMSRFMEEASTAYDFVFFDTPPVLAVADAQVLANQCDGSIFVVNSGKTDRAGALKAKELLTQAQAKVLGVVLNQKPKGDDNSYYYYYGTSK
ncbi:CpsD/CapB family tyrosine-protein kinase [Bacillus solitudinis]|uniref:CpsD/CapB family tyrosine-protein kinase n=1 Tax=Bacillus solitudinis TaxID=2014074 RepID=UPI000C245E3D|nr:CpsD/CapB family tyrosine-protein kinase [Bacillus solitudinis]